MSSVIQIRQAQREGARVVIGLSGISGSGKTLSGLLLAYGMTGGDGSKIGFIDTENRRGSLYASEGTYQLVAQSLGIPREQVTPFFIGDLQAPFSPQRYIDAIQAFQKHGVEVLVIDSVTHEWEGSGGCEEIAENNKRGKMKDWATAKREHKRFVNAMLQCDMHTIVCIRAREKVQIIEQNGKRVVEPIGIQPVQEKNFMFEMTASLMMWNEGRDQEVHKCPEELRPILGRQQGYITAADGRALRDWVDGARQLDPTVEKYRNRLQSVTENGLQYVKDAWSQTPEQVRQALGEDFRKALYSSAEAFDHQRNMAGAGGDEDLADLNSQLESQKGE